MPPQHFVFAEPSDSSRACPVSFFPVFADSAPAEIIEELQKESANAKHKVSEALEALEQHYKSANFKAQAGQILYLAEYGLLLGGMGRKETWHPEKLCELFRSIGSKLSSLKDISLRVYITEALLQCLDEHRAQREPFAKSLPLDFHARNKKDAKQESKAKQKEEEEEEEKTKRHDFIAASKTEDIILQLVACINIGAASMEVCKSKAKPQKKPIYTSLACANLSQSRLTKALERGRHVSEMIHGARYIASLPGNLFHPGHYERYALKLAKTYKLKCRVFQEAELRSMGCGGILAVGQGSAIPPRMILLEHRPPQAKFRAPLVLVGKGITFDTGGISIKPAADMHEMKYDMCGSALALHSIALAALARLPLSVVALLGIAENMPGANAIKPGDVYTAYDGASIEIQNTDAEGRLVLGDLLAYASLHYNPLCILDFATLTGACLVALGNEAAGLMTASEELASRLNDASLRSLDRLWRLPHWSVYGAGLKSEVADQRNIAGRGGGTISAMRFLAHFVPEEIAWAHIDIAGAAWRSKAFGSQGKGSTAWGIRLMAAFMEDLLAS